MRSLPNRGARICVTASPAATQVPAHRLQVTSSPIAWSIPPWTGSSSSPECAFPLTNGSRRKLVTSSCDSVLDALNAAAPRTTKSRAVLH